ncbi:MAG: PQQ-binding-like beta-propeller repeat protein [Planctomycetaceae bacterium]|nr:PQQ-binding-like beta-propeller repeat protein [Planctomycetaceae bacterium]
MHRRGLLGWGPLCLLMLAVPALRSSGEDPPPAAEPKAAEPKAAAPAAPGNAQPAAPKPAPAAVPAAKVQVLQQGVRGGAILRGNVVLNAGQGPQSLDEVASFAKDRTTEQRLKKARDLLDEKRYAEAVQALGSIVEAPEDFFYQPQQDSPVHHSLKAEAQRLIGAMPAAGRQSYELQFGARAQQMLDEALAKRDIGGITEVSRRFFHTEAGYRATYLLGLHHLDQSRPLAAALCFVRLREVGAAANAWEPALSVTLAACWKRAGLNESALQTLAALKEKLPAARLTLGGEEVRLFDRPDQALAWLDRHVTPGAMLSSTVHDDWTMYRGNPARNGTSAGGVPLLEPSWWVSTTEDPGLEKLFGQLSQTYRESNFVALPALHPLVVNDLVLMRTATTLLAVDFKTGKRMWDVPIDETLAESLDISNSQPQIPNSSQIIAGLDQRLWDDATYGTLSSDGAYVFSVEDLSVNIFANLPQTRMVVLQNGRRQPPPAWPRNFNRLTAHEIRTGKLKWETGGPRGEVELGNAGAFFLGAPLPLMGSVYCLAEVNSEIRLLALDAKSGKTQWTQQLAVVEVDVLQDPQRRLAGVSPSYSDGILVCPTASGAIIAVDLTTRSLLWGYRYTGMLPNANGMMGRRISAMVVYAGRPRDETDRWVDSSLTIADGKVLVTPVESAELHCLNLLDGSLAWKMPRGENLYVAGVHQGRAILVGRNTLTAIQVADKAPAWKPETIQLPSGSTPSGRGFLSGDHYYLPLSNGEVAAIDLVAGKITSRTKARGNRVPGNLVAYRGQVLSQGVDRIEIYPQLEPLMLQVAEVLQQKPDDPRALAQRGEIRLYEGKLTEAVADLRRSFELQSDPHTRELLVAALLEGLSTDFGTYFASIDELDRLASEPRERVQLLRLMASGLQTQGNRRAAFEAYLRLTDPALGVPDLDRIGPKSSARRDRLVQAGLKSLVEASDAPERAAIEETIGARLAAAIAMPGPTALRDFLRYFGGLPHGQGNWGDEVREPLAERLATGGVWLEAEGVLRGLERSPQESKRRAAVARLAQLLTRAGRPDEGLQLFQRLQNEWPDAVCIDGKTGSQLAAEALELQRSATVVAVNAPWPTGAIETSTNDRPTPPAQYFPAELQGNRDLTAAGFTVELTQDRQSILGRDGNGLPRWRVALSDPTGQLPNSINPQVLQARAAGHLVIVSMGQHIAAIDTLADAGAGVARLLWMRELGETLPGVPIQTGVQVRQMELPWGQRRNLISDAFGRNVGWLGPITGNYFCVQRGRELQALDPLTGDLLWTRQDVEQGSEVFGDDELLFLVAPNETEATVLRGLDGADLGKRLVPPANHRVAALGRQLVAWESGDMREAFRLLDPWSEDEVWRREFATGSKAYQLGQQVLAVVEPEGKFTLVNLSDGRVLVEAALEAEPQLSDVYLLASPERWILFTNRFFPNHQNGISIHPLPNGFNNPLINGLAYGFDRQTGAKVWGPVTIDKQGLALEQPAELPIITLASRIYERRAPRTGSTAPYTSILCLDKRSGQIAYKDRFEGHIGVLESVADPAKHTIELKLQNKGVVLTFTDKPPPPAEKGEATAGQAGGADASSAPTDAPAAAPPAEGKPAEAQPAAPQPAQPKPEVNFEVEQLLIEPEPNFVPPQAGQAARRGAAAEFRVSTRAPRARQTMLATTR